MRAMKQEIIELFENALTVLGYPQASLIITRPDNPDHGTYTTNIALTLSKEVNKKPRDIAQEILETINKDQSIITFINSISIAGPGFINVTISNESIIHALTNEIKTTQKKNRLVIEYTQPNPFKEMHIGHLYSNAVGESLARLHEAVGWDVKRLNYQGDVGMHVAKSLYGLLQLKEEKTVLEFVEELSKKPLEERVGLLGKAYAIGSTDYEDNEDAKEQIKRLNIMAFLAAQRMNQETKGMHPVIHYQTLLDKLSKDNTYNQEDIFLLYSHGRTWSLEYFETRYRLLGTTFDGYYFESMIAESGYQLVNSHIDDGIFEKHEGAVVYRGEKDGLHTRVFINSLGLPVYEAKDLGLAPAKYKDWNYDKSIIVTAKEIDEYFKVILAVLGKIYPELAKKTVHTSHGLVKLPEGKMSSRTGNVKTTDWLIETVKDAVREVMQNVKDSFTQEEYDDVLNKLTVATIKYSLLRVSLPSDIAFDIQKSVSLDGDSGPYLLYTYARCKSVLRKSMNSEINKKLTVNTLELEEKILLRHLFYFPEFIHEAAESYAPSTIARYLIETAQLFNSFYAKHHILKTDGNTDLTENQSQLRLFLTSKTAEILKEGIHLLGMETLERM